MIFAFHVWILYSDFKASKITLSKVMDWLGENCSSDNTN